jgi:hypothetical protein
MANGNHGRCDSLAYFLTETEALGSHSQVPQCDILTYYHILTQDAPISKVDGEAVILRLESGTPYTRNTSCAKIKQAFESMKYETLIEVCD